MGAAALGLLAWFGGVDPTQLSSRLSSPAPGPLMLAIVAALAATALRAGRYAIFFPAPGRAAPLYGAFALLRFVNYVLPLRAGDLAAIALLRRRRLAPSVSELSPVWLLMRAGDLSALALCLAALLLVHPELEGVPLELRGWVLGVAVLALPVAVVGMAATARLLGDGDLAERLRAGVRRALAGGGLAGASVLSLCIWATTLASVSSALMAFDAPLPFSSCALAAALALAFNLLPIRAPLGLGTADAAWTASLFLVGVELDVAVELALGVRLVQMAVVAGDGALGAVLARPDGPEASPSAEAGVPVLYVAGWGHSGSTLLDLATGSSPDVVSLGEMVFFEFHRDEQPHRKVLTEFRCTCGEPLRSCPFWSAVLERTGSDLSVPYDETGSARAAWLLRYLGARGLGIQPSGATGDDAALCAAALEVDGRARMVCDSSKDFARLVRLLLDPGLDVLPVHLIREGCGVAHSYAKPWREAAGLERMSFARALLTWAGVNLVTRIVLGLSGRPFAVLRYEDFCRDPEDVLQRLGDWAGFRPYEGRVADGIRSHSPHNIGGNPLRFDAIDELRIDERWRGELGGLTARLGQAFAAPIYRWLTRGAIASGR